MDKSLLNTAYIKPVRFKSNHARREIKVVITSFAQNDRNSDTHSQVTSRECSVITWNLTG
jgi:hypothetical protein